MSDVLYFNNSIQSFLKWLAELSETSLQVDSMLLWTQSGTHKNRRHLGAISMFSNSISIHRVSIYPKYVSQPLYKVNQTGLILEYVWFGHSEGNFE